MSQSISIDGRRIGVSEQPYIIAEMSANHRGRLETALRTIEMAKQMGADALKMQTYSADTMTIECDNDEFQIAGGLWDGYSLYELYEEAQTPYEWHGELFEHARKLGVTIFSSPFDESAVNLLEDLNAPAYKIASFEATDLPLIKYAASTGKPMIISTGMADLEEIGEAVTAAREAGCRELALLHCVSGYPTPPEQYNLRTIPDLAQRFGTVVGLSDHTLGINVAVASVAIGASVIEKHVTLSRKEKGPDSEFSLEPHELEALCKGAREAWQALGTAGYEQKSAERASQQFRRSLYIVEDVKQGEVLTSENVRRIRPGFGLPPKYYDQVLGKKAKRALLKGSALEWDMMEN